MKFKEGDVIRITNLPRTWNEEFKVGEKYTIKKFGETPHYKGPSIHVHGVNGYLLEEHVDYASKLHEVLK